MKLNMYGNQPIITPRDPQVPMEAANKNYVDNSISAHANNQDLHLTAGQNTFLDNLTVTYQELNALSGTGTNVQAQIDGKVAKTGDIMTGFLTLSDSPVDNLHAATKLYVDNKDALKVSKAGDTMTGALVLPGDPTSALQAAPKQYVDSVALAHESNASLHLTGEQNTFLDNLNATFTEVNSLVGISGLVQDQLDTKVAKSGSTMTGTLVLSGNPVANLDATPKQYVDSQDALKVAKAGDTMTGALVLPGDPTTALQAAPKQYVDSTVTTHASDETLHLTAGQNTFLDNLTVTYQELNALSGNAGDIQTQLDSKVAKAGDTMTGPLVLPGDPVANLQAAPKQYVDNQDALKVAKAGDTMTGALVLPGDPIADLQAAPKQYVDSTLATHATDASLHVTASQNTLLDAITVSAADINQLTDISGNVQSLLDLKFDKVGGAITGALVLPGNPTANLEATPKQYVDAQDALKVAKAGDTMTGALVLPGDPTANLEAAPKQYVDTKVATHADDASLHVTASQNTLLDSLTVTAADINQLSGVTGNVQSLLDLKFDKVGGTVSGDITMSAGKTIFVSKVPTSGTELVNKTYVDSLVVGQKWEDPVTDINLVSVSISTPPVSPVSGDVYVIGTGATDAWVSKEGYATYFNGTSWVFLQDRAVAAGDRFGVAFTSSTVPADALTGKQGALLTITNGTPGAVTFAEDVIAAGSTTLVFDPQSSKFGVTYTRTDEGTWVATNTSVNLTAGDGLSLTGNILNFNYGTGLDIDNDVIKVKFDANKGIALDVGGAIYVPQDGSTITITSSGVKVSDAVMADIANRISKTDASTVTGAVTFTATGSLKTEFTPTGNTDVVNKQFVDTADTALQIQIDDTAAIVNTLNTDPVTKAYTDSQDALKVAKAGDTMTGALVLPGDPISGLQAAPKQYVDSVALAHESNAALHMTAAQNTLIDAITVTSTEINSLAGVDSNVQDQIDSKVAKAGDTMTGALVLPGDPVNALEAAPKQYVDSQDALKVAKAGDTMTGALVLPGNPVADLQAAPKQYVDSTITTHAANQELHLTTDQNVFLDNLTVTYQELNALSGTGTNVQAQIDSKVAKAGDTMTGALVLSGNPVNALEAAPKQYVDSQDALKVAKAGDTMTGYLTLNADPTSNLHAATKAYVDSTNTTHATDASLHLTSIQNALLDAVVATASEINTLQNIAGNVQDQIDSKVAKAGDTMTGALVLPGDPVAALEAAPKQYVNSQDALKVAKAGDTMTGALVLPADPVAAMQASTKQYVDSTVATHSNNASLHISTEQNTFLDGLTVTFEEVNQLSGINSNVQNQLDSKLNLSGGTLTGFLSLHANPTANLQAVPKQYADSQDALKVAKAGDTMTGALVLPADPVNALEASTKQYVDSTATTLTTYVDTQDAFKVAKAGDTMSGLLTLSGAPVQDMHAATKLYVDTTDINRKSYVDAADLILQNQISAVQATVDTLDADAVTKMYVDSQDALKVAKAGDTLTGYLTLHADPQQAMHPTTKQYVDAIAQGLATKPAVRLATTVNLPAVYSNGNLGVNATLTGSANAALSVDGKDALVNDRILVMSQTDKTQNGDYVVQQVGNASSPFILKRVNTVDESAEVPSSFFYVADGETLKGTGWTFSVADPVSFTIGTDAINVNQFSGSGALIAGQGLTIDGNTIDINTANPTRIVVNADNIDLAQTAVNPGTYTRVTVDGYGRATAGFNPNTLAGYGITDGQLLNANLTSLSDVTTTGVVVRDATNTMVTKTVTVGGVGLSITNGSGANAGDIAIASNATAVATPETVVSRDASGNFGANVITAALNGNANTATALQNTRDFSVIGDTTAPAVTFNGTGNVVLNTTLADTTIVAGTYTKTTFDSKGRATGGITPTAIADLGVTDVYTKAEIDVLAANLRKEMAELYLYIINRI